MIEIEKPISDEEFVYGVDFSNLDTSLIIEEDLVPSDNDTSQVCDSNGNNNDDDYRFRIGRMLEIAEGRKYTSIVAGDAVEDSDYEKVFEWAKSRGAILDGIRCREDAYGGRGLFADASSFLGGDVVAVLPRALRIGQETACRQLRLPSTTPDLSALSLLVLDMVLSTSSLAWKSEDDVDGNENFDVYAAILPKYGYNALFMKDEEIKEWSNHGNQYEIDIRLVRKQADSCIRYIQDYLSMDPKRLEVGSYVSNECCINEDISSNKNNGSSKDDILLPLQTMKAQLPTLRWAIQIVQSRTHGFGTGRSRWMTPIFDFANHSPNPNCKLEGDDSGGLIMRAVRPIKADEEITIDYQVPDDAKLVATYGFSILH